MRQTKIRRTPGTAALNMPVRRVEGLAPPGGLTAPPVASGVRAAMRMV
ncbi:MAG: hypothetical protein KDI64_17700 [Candidatus Accumulibacter sp.]|nr:hypothetical protein [Accumulibacter sp.]